MMADASNGEFKGRRWHAALYEFLTKGDQKWLSRHRPHIIGEADGRVLEIGAGTGNNFPYYEKAREVMATEPDPFMLARAQKHLDEMGPTNVELRQAAAEDLPFDDGSFDHVVSALVLCTVRDPVRALSEARRVLKPGGTLRFIEHVRYDEGLRGRVQDVAAPVWRYFGGGCHLNRRTDETIAEAGFEMLDLTRHKIAVPGPVLVGVARRA
jgi:ubiquinone/menaquinone biosynthesis C-methylase UbiE